MRFLRKNTAVRITVGPFFDKTDGVTPEVALTVTSCKLTATVDADDGSGVTLVLDTNPTASGGSNDMVHITNDDAGYYDLELAAANVNYNGRFHLAITDAATHCPVFHEFMILPALVYDSLVAGSDNLQVDTIQVSGTTQTARDLGASVLLSSGTGTGQLDFTSGVVKSNLAQILGTALTETAGQIAAAFKKFFDKAAPTGTINSLPDAVPGAAGGVFIAGSNAATSVTTALTANITGNLSGSVGSVTGHTPQTGDTYALANGANGFVALKAETASIQSDTNDIQTRLPAALTADGNMKSDALAVNGSTNAAANLGRGTLGVVLGTVDTGASTTSIPTSSLDPAASVSDQFKGRIVTFDRATTTAALRGQSTDITANTAGGTLTVTALTTAPASGDTFTIT